VKVYKSYAKVNIFLKITGMRNNYHEIISRFMLVNALYDELSFSSKKSEEFKIIGNFSCSMEQNTIYKAYKALLEYTKSNSLENLIKKYAVKVEKNIPAYAGLGGGSSNAATFLKMCNSSLNLGLSLNELANIGLKVGADVPFFIYGYQSANVSGIGEVVEEFQENSLEFEIYTPKLEISTPKVYKSYRENFYKAVSNIEVDSLKVKNSLEVLQTMNADEANDLLKPALLEYSELKKYYKQGYFFSGSGSSFFKLKEENK
jgi:4-diphosphocytidyl-2-C-methyl-D-erythritol kinase